MGIECLIVDFDGTLTDAERHAPDFHQATRAEIALILGVDLRTVESWWAEAEAFLRSVPIETGWEDHGNIVVPVRADPYFFANALAKRIIELHSTKEELVLNAKEIVFQIHKTSYERVKPPFRPQVKSVLKKAVNSKKHIYVVTNSIGNSVARQLDGLGLGCREQIVVRGGAQKFVVAPPLKPAKAFSAIPDSIRVAGLDRPVLLKRGRYFDILRDIWDETHTTPSSTLVCGDIFELDLAMPAALGTCIHLVARPTTLAHERQAALHTPCGGADDNLAAILDRLN